MSRDLNILLLLLLEVCEEDCLCKFSLQRALYPASRYENSNSSVLGPWDRVVDVWVR